jgi:hypothetical protein
MNEMQQAVTEFIVERVREGFEPYESIVEMTIGNFDDEYDSAVLEPFVITTAKQLLLEHYQMQRQWTQPTDCDRLDQAFAELNKRGVVARQHFTCCSNCGHSSIWDEIEQAEADGQEIRGYTFYHKQDTEYAAHGSQLYLAFSGEDDVQIAREIVEVMEAHGFKIRWNGQADTRIALHPLDWKRRRVEEDLSQVE